MDAGGGAIVDLLPPSDGGEAEEIFSARKVLALRRRAVVVYIKVSRWSQRTCVAASL